MADNMRRLNTHEDIVKFIESYDQFIFDCDGVLWNGSHVYEGARHIVKELKSANKHVLFLTNNSSKSRMMYYDKLKGQGFDIKPENVFPASYATGLYLSDIAKVPKEKSIYVIGGEGLVDEIRNAGYTTHGGPEEDLMYMQEDHYKLCTEDPNIGAVVCGLDRSINYYKFCKAQIYLTNPDCLFIATNADAVFPVNGRIFPGAGSLLSVLKMSTKREPIIICKPSSRIMETIEDLTKVSREKTAFIGDNLHTDILFAKNSKLGASLLVLSGVTSEENLLDESNDIHPDYYCSDVDEIMRLYKDDRNM